MSGILFSIFASCELLNAPQLTIHICKLMKKWFIMYALDFGFLVSGRDFACQQEVSLALTKTLPIHYYNVVDSAFNFYAEYLRI